MVIPESIAARLRKGGNNEAQNIRVLVPRAGQRKVIERIDIADIAFIETANHHLRVHTMDDTEFEIISTMTELLDMLKAKYSAQNPFMAFGRFYVVNLNNLEPLEDTDYSLFFKMSNGETRSITPSKKSMDDFHRKLFDPDETDVPIAEKLPVQVCVPSTGGGPSNSGLRGFTQPGGTTYRTVLEYWLDDDKVYLI